MNQNNNSDNPIETGILYVKLSTTLKMFFVSLYIIYIFTALILNFNLIQLLQIVIACYYFYQSYAGVLCWKDPTLQNLKRFQNLCMISQVINIITFIIVVGVLNQQMSLNQQQIRLIYAGFFFVIICINDYANYSIVNMWIYITLQQMASQHPPPNMYDYKEQIDLQNIKEQNGPGKLFMIISNLFQILILILQLVFYFSYYPYYQQIIYGFQLVSSVYFFYHYTIGVRSACSPTVKNLAKFIKSSKIIGFMNLLSFSFIQIVGMLQMSLISLLLESEIGVYYFLITFLLGFVLIMLLSMFIMICVFAFDMTNYINSCFWIYIILQRKANQHPPPYFIDVDNQNLSFQQLTNSRFESQQQLNSRNNQEHQNINNA